MTEIYKSTPSSSYSPPGFSIGVPNYEAIAQHKFKDVEKLDFYFCNFPPGHLQVGKHCFKLQINCSLSSPDIMNGLCQELQFNEDQWKLVDAQKVIFKKSKLIYHLSTKTEHKLNPEESFSLKLAQHIAQANQKPVINLLKEEIDELIRKAEGIYIPKMAPKYFFAKVVMAFCEEVDRHRAMRLNK